VDFGHNDKLASNQMQIPSTRIYNKSFKNIKEVVLMDIFPVKNKEIIELTFESKNSDWRQGVWLACDQGLEINNQRIKSTELWFDSAPTKVSIECFTSNGLLTVYNVWEDSHGRNSQSHTSGMLVDELPLGRRYRCNDIGFQTNFDKIVFRIEHRKD
jgi:hypothetical protein